ncbi:YbhB/YbcL family Raf kinase inhibitor-like protein [Vibrio sp. SCSIO 43135]|uniref:YbhB/YbcL family Raf kinase inhibitor-like protein n=1 Tax=Vibrio paucivorans TaxID=2829489 RepID=A0A9X3CH59_9VIBR|nr:MULTISPECIES: YbhB/YbcL family Raf kinase inhibitor-like protein [Vibrio]MCW8335777.1 YbhB/YbcL family Raf kinase inhibitor-like protein [Vibrio paucivorans]USD41943.1 YbhB/YbcL family Raf kinase inhibitor-like protein [Vibrio sp. SCSIO 43135]
MKKTILTLSLSSMMISGQVLAFELTSQDIKEGYPMAKTFEFSGWGCSGENLSPQLSWKGAPKGTKSFAITAYDPDAPTGSGFWHWVAFNIPADVSQLPRGADIQKLGGLESGIDYGIKGFGGACPPVDDGMHRYQFTVWAIPETTLSLTENTPAAVVGFTLNSVALAKTTLTATYTR